MTRGGHISIFLGDPIENATETACLRRLLQDLQALDIDAVILANFTLGPKRRQIDLVVATANTALVIEIKGYVHAVHGGVNGPWELDAQNSARTRLGPTNPYQQALTNRYAVTDSMASLLGLGSDATKKAVGGMLCLFPAPVPSSQIPQSDFKLEIGGYADLIGLLSKARPGALPLEAWRRLAQSADLSDASAAPPSEAEAAIAGYLGAFADLADAAASPYIEPQFEGAFTTDALAAQIAAGAQLQIVGPSGSGKSELLKALARSTTRSGNLPVMIRAGDFERRLAPLLQAAIARCSPSGSTELFKAAMRAGAEIIFFVDGLNECPADRRNDLIAALQAARINYGARIILAGQEPTSLPAMLTGDEIRLAQPDHAQARRLVAAHLGRPLADHELGAVEIVATAHDAAILAAMLEMPAAIDGRFALYHGFTDARLDVRGRQQMKRSLSALATTMRTGFVASMPRAAAERILNRDNDVDAVIAREVGLVRIDANRLAFRHDLIADFFAADDVLRHAATPAELSALANRPINAELREFLLGGCATTAEIDALIGPAPDSRLLRAALSGRASGKARAYVLGRMRDLIGKLKHRYGQISLSLPDGVTTARDLHSLIPSLPNDANGAGIEKAYLHLIPFALGDGLMADLLDLFAAVDRRLVGEAQRLRDAHPDVRIAWRAAAYGTVYGMHHHSPGGRDLQDLLNAIQNAWFGEQDGAPDLGLRDYLNAFEALSPGQLFFLVSALHSANIEPLPYRFPEVLHHIWELRVYHLRLYICDIIRFRGSDLPPDQREAVRDALDGWLSNDNIVMNSILFDALEGVDGIETTLTLEAAVQEYEAMLALPESPEACSMAVSAVTRTYDHPFRDIYWEAFYEVLPVEKRQALLLRGLRDEQRDAWFIDDILRALHRNPTAAAAPELQKLALRPIVEGHSHQHALHVYADAIALLAKLAIPLAPPEPPPDDPARRAWYRAAPLIHALNSDPVRSSHAMAAEVAALSACGAAEAFDVVQRLAREARNIGHPANVAFESVWPELVLDLCRSALSPGYAPVSLFERIYFDRTLADDHFDLALALIAKVGRPTDVALVSAWLTHPRHGERALATARELERRSD
ncbi:NERD domain-containing protein [Sphingobium sp.]|uniref:NERD domain-containing protein n=1 Tax=Sphingobium sp. TaxID=1912891 RepID=UPI0025EFF8BE|nr:NERD domain-containing protein [Sphingobium sp.]